MRIVAKHGASQRLLSFLGLPGIRQSWTSQERTSVRRHQPRSSSRCTPRARAERYRHRIGELVAVAQLRLRFGSFSDSCGGHGVRMHPPPAQYSGDVLPIETPPPQNGRGN